MKSIIQTILLWVLTLSLVGLPVIAQSQDIADLQPAEKSMPMQIGVHCHSSQDAVAVDDITTTSSCDGCCDSGCQCDTSCQSVHLSSCIALLQSSVVTSTQINSQLVIEATISYCEYDSDVEKFPPIV